MIDFLRWIIIWCFVSMMFAPSIVYHIEYLIAKKMLRVKDLWLLLLLPTTIMCLIVIFIFKNVKSMKLNFSKIKCFLNKRII